MAKELLVLLQLLLLLASCAHVDVSSMRAHQLGEEDAHTYVDHDQAKPWPPGPAPQPFAWVDNSCTVTPSSTPSLKSDDVAVASAQQRIQLTATAIIVNASELAYVKYAAEDLGSYLHSLGLSSTQLVTTTGTGSVNAVANSSTIIAIGAAAASALGVDVSSISKLGKDESKIFSDRTNDGRTIVVVAGLDPHGTNTGVATLLRAIEMDPKTGPYVNGPLDTMNRPSYLKRGLHLNGWPLKYPYSFRVWKEADWMRFIDMAWVQRINLFYLWPFMEIIPLPLSSEDRSYLQEVRRVVDYAQNKRGMEVWIFQSANRIGVSDCSSVDPRERPYWVMGKSGTSSGCQQDMNPANATQFAQIISHFQAFYEIVDNADSYNFIDSDPGGWPGSPLSEQMQIFDGARTLLDKYSVQGEQTKLADWMWHGWGNPKSAKLADFWQTKTIANFQQNLAGPWQLVAGMSLDLAAAENRSVLVNTTFLQYNAIEAEPSVPGTNLLNDHSGANPVKQMLETADQYPALGGIMGNNMIPCIQLPRTFYFSGAAWNCSYANTSEEELLLELGRQLYPDHAALVQSAFLALAEVDAGTVNASLTGISQLLSSPEDVRPGLMGRFVFPDKMAIAANLQLQLAARYTRQALVNDLRRDSSVDAATELVENYFEVSTPGTHTQSPPQHDFEKYTRLIVVLCF